ncbi:MAG: putative lipid II flippase FtsW [Chloroflexi bacterium]|nr:putative lipid II flippase FtsW [Chloroflexota bacterium]
MAARAKTQGKRSTKRSKRRRVNFDYALLLVVAGLLIVGLMMVYSATFDWSYQVYENSFRIASRQFIWAGAGLIVMLVVAAVPYDQWKQWAVPVMGGALFLLLLVLFIGDDRFGARRSFLDGSVQPGELVKPVMVIYVAAWLASKGEQVRDVTYGLVPFAVLIGVIAGLVVLQPDVSTAVLLVLTALAMFFFAGADVLQLAGGGLISGVTFLALVNQLPHARQRVDDYVLTWSDPTRVGHHIQQALIAMGSGGLFGVGLGQGEQKLGYLPTPHTDSIFAVLGEELGFMGSMIVIGLFVLLTWRGFKIAVEAPDAFAALVACGVTCWLAFQALVNIAVMTGLIPFTGVALPFISAGGSAMVVSLAGIGLLLSVSRGKRTGRRDSRNKLGFGQSKGRKDSRQRANLDRRWGNRGTRLSRPGRRTSTRR